MCCPPWRHPHLEGWWPCQLAAGRGTQGRASEVWAAMPKPGPTPSRLLGWRSRCAPWAVPTTRGSPALLSSSGSPRGPRLSPPYPLHSQGSNPQHSGPTHAQHQAGISQEEVHGAAQHLVTLLPPLLGELCHGPSACVRRTLHARTRGSAAAQPHSGCTCVAASAQQPEDTAAVLGPPSPDPPGNGTRRTREPNTEAPRWPPTPDARRQAPIGAPEAPPTFQKTERLSQ